MRERKRILLSLSRKKSNLLLLGILFFLIFFMLVSVSIYNTSQKNVSAIEKTYGISFSIGITPDKNDMSQWEERVVEGLDSSIQAYIGSNVDEAMVRRISEEVEKITDYEAGSTADVMLYGYDLVPGFGRWDYEFFSSALTSFITVHSGLPKADISRRRIRLNVLSRKILQKETT